MGRNKVRKAEASKYYAYQKKGKTPSSYQASRRRLQKLPRGKTYYFVRRETPKGTEYKQIARPDDKIYYREDQGATVKRKRSRS